MHWEVLLANPTPLVLAQLTYHMGASAFLFYFDSTVLARAYVFRVRESPFLITFVYLFIARFAQMPYI